MSEATNGEHDENQDSNEESDWRIFPEWILFPKRMHEAINIDQASASWRNDHVRATRIVCSTATHQLLVLLNGNINDETHCDRSNRHLVPSSNNFPPRCSKFRRLRHDVDP